MGARLQMHSRWWETRRIRDMRYDLACEEYQSERDRKFKYQHAIYFLADGTVFSPMTPILQFVRVPESPRYECPAPKFGITD